MTLTSSGFNYRAGKDIYAGNGSTLSFWVVGTCDITLTYYYNAWGTINDVEFGENTTSDIGTGTKKITVNGAASGTKVTITTKGAFSTYLLSIDIQYTSNVDDAWAALKAKLANNATYNLRASGLSVPYTSADGKLYVNANAIDTSHGATLANGNELTLAVQGAAKITFGNCRYDNAATVTVTNTTTGTPLASMSISKGDGSTDGSTSYIYNGASGTLKFVPNAQIYLHQVQVEYVY